jgi:hypothetical protein
MSAGKHLGGVSKIFYGTTAGLSTSVQITSLWSGTTPGDTETITGQDASGRNVQTGVRRTGQIFTTAVTAAFITNLIAAADNCTELYVKYYMIDGNVHKYGPGIVTVGAAAGNVDGLPHRVVISHESFTEDILDHTSFTG